VDDDGERMILPRMVSVNGGVSSAENLGRCGTRLTLTVNGLLTLDFLGSIEVDGKSEEGIV
jgi:hypothetical protein